MSDLLTHLAALSPERRALLELLILEEALEGRDRAPAAGAPAPETGTAPASFGQERLWLMDRVDPGSTAYNLATALRLTGALERGVLLRSFEEIARRHAVLRTTFREEAGEPVQVVGPPRSVDLPLVDLSGLEPALAELALREGIAQEIGQPFDLARGPVYRVRLFRLGEREHVLLATLHHIVSDAWSMGVLARELTAIHAAFAAGLPSPLPELPLRYADYARAQRERGGLDEQLAYWRARLAGAPEVVEVPPDRPRPAARRFRGGLRTRRLPLELAERVARLCRERSATPFMVLLAAFEVVLYTRTGQTDLVVGVDVANRNPPETEALIGFFVNQLVMRVDTAGDPIWLDLLERVRETVLGAFAHQDVPFGRLVEELSPQRSLARNPLFQVMFGLYNVPDAEAGLGGLRVENVDLEVGTAVFDLSLYLSPTPEGLTAMLRYDADLYEPATAEALLDDFEAVARRVVDAPAERLSALAEHLSALAEHLSAERRRRLEAGREDLQKARLRTLKTARRRTLDTGNPQ
jgi:non-ribosomal peptide synthetase component F